MRELADRLLALARDASLETFFALYEIFAVAHRRDSTHRSGDRKALRPDVSSSGSRFELGPRKHYCKVGCVASATGHHWRSHARNKHCNMREYGSALQTAGVAGTLTVLAGSGRTVAMRWGTPVDADKRTDPMTGHRRTRAALATLITALGLLGLWAIPAASASSTGTVAADTAVPQQCVTAEFPNGIAMPFEIPASDPVPTDGAALALDNPTPALPNPSDVLQVIAGCSSSAPTTGTTSSSSTTTTSPRRVPRPRPLLQGRPRARPRRRPRPPRHRRPPPRRRAPHERAPHTRARRRPRRRPPVPVRRTSSRRARRPRRAPSTRRTARPSITSRRTRTRSPSTSTTRRRLPRRRRRPRSAPPAAKARPRPRRQRR